MNNSIPLMLLLQLVLILCNAVFACAEIAVISMNENRLKKLSKNGDKRADKVLNLTSEPAKFLATIQVAITLSGFLGSAFAADNFSNILVDWIVDLGINIPRGTLDTLSVIFITILLSYVTLILGELVPKRIAMRKSEKISLVMSGGITIIAKLFSPIVWLLTKSTNGVLRLMGIDPNQQEEELTEDEIRMLLDEGSKKGVIAQDENEIIQNVFEFDDITAGEIATHRTELSILWMEESVDLWDKTIKNSEHRFYPICDESIDNIVGILDSKEYFRLDNKDKDNIINIAVKKPYFVPEGVKADVLFRDMKESKNSIVGVLDEYGGITGIVTMNDLIEQLLGDFITSTSGVDEEPEIKQIDSSTWTIKGSASLDDIEDILNVNLPKEDFDTFNGLVFGTLGKFPEDGSSIEVEVAGLNIKVIEIKEHKVEKAIVGILDKGEETAIS